MPDRVTKADVMAGLGTAVVAYWAGIPVVIQAMTILAGIDYATGLGKAFVRREVSSQAGYRGAVRKGMAFLLVAAGWVAHYQLGVPVPLDQVVAGFFCGSELISIVENCEQAGLRVPVGLTKYFQALKGERDAC